MNWVGGYRHRIIFKQERRKQKEFFERKKLNSKLKLLQSSPSPRNASISLDLLNLYVVNQISSKKEVVKKKALHFDLMKSTTFPNERNNAELPMSPITAPSKIYLADSEINKHMPCESSPCMYQDDRFKKDGPTDLHTLNMSCSVEENVVYHRILENNTDDELPISAAPVTYSPWTSDSYVSESSEMQSEDEEAADTETENTPRSRETKKYVKIKAQSAIMPGYHNEIYTKHMPIENIQTSQIYDGIDKDIKAKHSSSFYCDLSYICDNIKESKLNVYKRQDAWCQTDTTSDVAKACHVAVQCDILQKCKCTRQLVIP